MSLPFCNFHRLGVPLGGIPLGFEIVAEFKPPEFSRIHTEILYDGNQRMYNIMKLTTKGSLP